MLFNSLAFLAFIPVFLSLYYITKGRLRLFICLAGSYLFYGWWDARFLILIMAITAINYYSGKLLDPSFGFSDKQRKVLIGVLSGVNLGILFFFKYSNFFISSFNSFLSLFNLNSTSGIINIILPVGISFYTFQTMSYSIDIYRGTIKPETSILRFAVFVAFFPQLVAGPIIRASHFLPQLKKDQSPDSNSLIKGIQFIIWGYFLKCGVADSLAAVVDPRFANPLNHDSFSHLVGVIYYGFQIYADFAGYSLIAIGLARLLGFEFMTNFKRPYFSATFTDFWKRWHISLSTWLRDYLYISLGGNKKGKLRSHLNRFVTMILGGLWHGASWTFVFWGFLQGLYLGIENAVILPEKKGGWFKFVYRFLVLVLIFIAWIFFRAGSFADAFYIFRLLFDIDGYQLGIIPQMFQVIKGFFLISLLLIVDFAKEYKFLYQFRNNKLLAGAFNGILLAILSLLGTFGESAFIYFQF